MGSKSAEGVMSQQELGVFIQSVCVHGLDLLADLAQVHIEIDHPERVMQADEPSWSRAYGKYCTT